jgi:hypothetical protein
MKMKGGVETPPCESIAESQPVDALVQKHITEDDVDFARLNCGCRLVGRQRWHHIPTSSERAQRGVSPSREWILVRKTHSRVTDRSKKLADPLFMPTFPLSQLQ